MSGKWHSWKKWTGIALAVLLLADGALAGYLWQLSRQGPEELRAQRGRRMFVGVHGAELGALFHRTLHLAFILFAGCAEKFPGQHFALNEEIIVEDAGRGRQQVSLLVFFLLSHGPALGQKIGVGEDHRLRLLGA